MWETISYFTFCKPTLKLKDQPLDHLFDCCRLINIDNILVKVCLLSLWFVFMYGVYSYSKFVSHKDTRTWWLILIRGADLSLHVLRLHGGNDVNNQIMVVAFSWKDGFIYLIVLLKDKQCTLDSGDEQMVEQVGDDYVTINDGKDFPSFEVISDTQFVNLSEIYPFN